MADKVTEHTLDDRSLLLPETERNKSLRASVWDGCFYSGMAGAGESYFIPLLEAIGATNMQVGVFAGIPHLCVAFIQFLAIYIIENVRLRRRIIVTGASVQALMLGVVFLLLLFNKQTPLNLMVAASIYFASNGVASPAWNSLMGDITQGIDRGRYFGARNGLCLIVLFCALTASGSTLQYFDNINIPLRGFTIIMLAAMLSRVVSVIFLHQHYDVPYEKISGAYFSFREFVSRAKQSNFAKFSFMIASMSFSVMVSGPFFAIYLLRHVGLSYFQYTISMGIIIVVQYVMMRQWGAFADKFGNRHVLKVTGFLLPVLPILWIFVHSFEQVIFIAILGGVAWSGWMLSSGNFIFDAVSSEKRARCSAYHFFFNSIGMFAGSLFGAFLTQHAPAGIGFGGFRFEFFTEIQFVFLVGGILRFAVAIMFLQLVREVRDVEKPSTKDVVMVFTNIRPLFGARFEPMLKSYQDKLESILKPRK